MRRSDRIRVDSDGRYVIHKGEMAPNLIAICIPDEGGWAQVSQMHLLDVIEPGESVELETGTLELHWTGAGAPIERVAVRYGISADGLTHPVRTLLNTCTVQWQQGTVLRLEGVPAGIDQLEIGQRRLAVNPSRREVVKYEVDWDALEPLAGNR